MLKRLPKTKILEMSLIESFEDNSIWEKLIFIDLEFNKEYWSQKIEDFLYYLDCKIQEVTEVAASWTNTYIVTKKIINALEYLQNYLMVYSEINGKLVEDEFNQTAFKWTDKITLLLYSIAINEILINKFKSLKKLKLNKEQNIILTNWLQKYFEINLEMEVKEEQVKLSKQLENYSRKFQQNHQQALWTEEYSLFVPLDKSAWLEGLSANTINTGKNNAKLENKNGWIYYVDDCTSDLLLSTASNRAFRKKVYQNYQNLNSDKRFLMNNDAILRNILSTKQKVAKLYKKQNYSELVLSEYILDKTPEVYNYLDSLEYELKVLIDNVKKNLSNQAAEDGIKELMPWDIPYYYHKIKSFHNFKKNDVFAEYFSLEDVWPKLLKFLSHQFDIDFKKIDHPLWTKENQLMFYQIKDKRTDKKGYWLISPFNNESKQTAYELDLLSAEQVEELLPCIQYISLQMMKGKYRTPLSLNNFIVLLHELGHAFHSFFAPVQDSLSNSLRMGWDLIELPSQFLEHLVYDKSFLIPLSKHYKTGKKITEELILDIVEKEQYFEGYEFYRQILKYRANFWLHENFKPYSKKNPHQIVEEKLAKEGVIYNIARDEGMICRNYNMDYGSTGYIYLYSAQLAFQLFEFYIQNEGHKHQFALRNIYEDIFNNPKHKRVKNYLDKYVDFEKTNILKFLQKTWNIDLYGINNWKDKEDNLLKTVFKE